MPHIPVLLLEVVHHLSPQKGESYLDVTAGYGGHAEAIINLTNCPEKAVLVDRDQNAVSHLKDRFHNVAVEVRKSAFLEASQKLVAENAQFDLILADLGVSSPQLDQAERGFSLAKEASLDMRMDQSQELTALELVNTLNQEELTKILRDLGEEPRAQRIASAIIAHKPVATTTELAAIVAQTAPRQYSGRKRIHPATKVFQALRIAVNSELTQLELSLPLWEKLLAPGGRLAVITFHSLEDRLVKSYFKEQAGGYTATLNILTKRPITGSEHEIAINPRARSAKLRAAAKIKK